MDSWVDEYFKGCDEHAWIVLKDQLEFDFAKFKQVRGPAGPTLKVEDGENNRIVLPAKMGFATKWVNAFFDKRSYPYKRQSHPRTPKSPRARFRPRSPTNADAKAFDPFSQYSGCVSEVICYPSQG
jgi:hypothetical protein